MLPLLLAPLLAKLAESGLGLLGNAVLNKGKQVVEEKLGVSLDSLVETEEGKQALLQLQTDHEEFLISAALDNRKLDLEFDKLQAAGTADARAMNTAIQESQYATWLSKNITPILALLVTFGGGAGILWSPESDVRLGLTALVSSVLTYYFGTSKGADKQAAAIQAFSQGAVK